MRHLKWKCIVFCFVVEHFEKLCAFSHPGHDGNTENDIVCVTSCRPPPFVSVMKLHAIKIVSEETVVWTYKKKSGIVTATLDDKRPTLRRTWSGCDDTLLYRSNFSPVLHCFLRASFKKSPFPNSRIFPVELRRFTLKCLFNIIGTYQFSYVIFLYLHLYDKWPQPVMFITYAVLWSSSLFLKRPSWPRRSDSYRTAGGHLTNTNQSRG